MGDQLDLFTAVPEINEAGVLDDDWSGVERLSDEGRRGKHPYWGWEIRIARFPDGLWRAAGRYMSGNCGFSMPLSVNWPGHATRTRAVQDIAGVFLEHLARETSPTAIRTLRDIEALAAASQEPKPSNPQERK